MQLKNSQIDSVEKNIGYSFKNKEYLQRACTHKSYANEKLGARDNERLEFLGDAVLQFVVTGYLFREYPHEQEGQLSAYRATLVNTDTLIRVAEKLQLKKYLRVSIGQQNAMKITGLQLNANAVEAIIGALYLDGGIEAAKKFIDVFILVLLQKIIKEGLWRDPKTKLQEKAQKNKNITPTYVTVKESGLDHERFFEVNVLFGDEKIALGTGMSKQEAERKAAENALTNYKW